jgi:hypothetical protein
MTLLLIIAAAYVVGQNYGSDAGWATAAVLVAVWSIVNDATEKIVKRSA